MISDFSRQILSSFQVRKSRRDKKAFIEQLRTGFPELRIEESRFPVRSRNIVIGDLESSSIVLTAHYDTCARMLVPNFITPLNRFISMSYQIGLGLVMGIAVGAIMGFICRNTIMRIFGTSVFSRLLSFVLIMYSFLWLLMLGPANRHTANDNTSGVITLLTLLERMTDEERKRCCVVLFDQEEKGLWGSKAFARKHGETMKEKLLVNFDCVSDGDYCLIMEKDPVLGRYDGLFRRSFTEEKGITPMFLSSKETIYPSDQNSFPCSSAVAFFRKGKHIGCYMSRIHTSKDVVFEERNIEYISDSMRRFFSLMNGNDTSGNPSGDIGA